MDDFVRQSYIELVDLVQEELNLNEDAILHSNKENCVRARHILIYILLDNKFTENTISELTGLKVQTIYKIKGDRYLKEKSDFSFKYYLKQIGNRFAMYLQ